MNYKCFKEKIVNFSCLNDIPSNGVVFLKAPQIHESVTYLGHLLRFVREEVFQHTRFGEHLEIQGFPSNKIDKTNYLLLLISWLNNFTNLLDLLGTG